MMKMYEISDALRSLAEQLDNAETSKDMREAIRDTMESLDMDFEEKSENIAAWIADNNAMIAGCKTEIQRLTDKVKRLDNQNDSLKAYQMFCMKLSGKTKVQAGTWQISIAKNGGKAPLQWKVDPDELDLKAIPDKYVKRTEEINTAAVRETLEAGGFLSFAELGERGESLRIK